ncbi:hypothetical protein CLF_107490 [Clonorchis sinensis]|uniref:Uncharacterized protein n=1 Tax=Clonorchis sinensis TaxID=79923 RepID=G7YGV8_CLOSI|nr:hypothetical protein CLF_107490 [Clonorchis sinensis]
MGAKKDLVILFSSNMSFSRHHEKLAQKAFAVLRVIRRTFSRVARMDFQILYEAYVRPLLEYANPVVYSGRTNYVILIELVQRAARKLVAGLKSVDYKTHFAVLDLFPLGYRPLRGDLILTYSLFEQGLANRFFTVDPANTLRDTSNGLPENFVRKLQSAITSFSLTSFVESDRGVGNFLMQFRDAVHSFTGKSPAILVKSCSLRTSLDCAKTADVTFFADYDLRLAAGVIISSSGKNMLTIIDLDDLSCHRRNIYQAELITRGQSVDGTLVVSNTNESSVDGPIVSEQNVISEEHTTLEEPAVSNPESERLRSRPPLNYKHPRAHSRCGGCDERD